MVAALITIFGAVPASASARALAPEAQSDTRSSNRVEALRAEADDLASRYFDTLARTNVLESEIVKIHDTVRDLRERAARARADARSRALSAYRHSGSRLATVVGADSVMVAARRVHLIDQINARDQTIYARARAARLDLESRRRTLESARQEQADTLARLRDEGAAIDQKLALAQQKEQQEEQERAAAARGAAQAAASPAPAPAPDSTAAPTSPPATTTTSLAPPAPAPPPTYSGTPGVHPRHDDPFLVCTRMRESSGNYAAVNPAGPYYGAYQFLQTTWNATANHAGRPQLVGVRPDRATPYDQDDMAWALYQWQGAGPWGGACT